MSIQQHERRPATALLSFCSRERTAISPATFALSNVARVPTTGCVRFIDYFDCYAGDSAAPAFMTPKFLPRISFPNAPFAISPEVFPLLFHSMGIFLAERPAISAERYVVRAYIRT